MSKVARRRTALLLLTLAAAALGFLATDPAATAAAMRGAGPDLARVLRGMAMLKVGFAGLALAAVLWRFTRPVPTGWATAYGAAAAAMAAGPGLVWQLAHLITGSILLHAGLLATIVLLWRDPVLSAQLSLAVAAKRRRLALMAGGEQQHDQRDRDPLQQNAPAH